MITSIQHKNGVPWHEAPAPWKFHKHKPHTRAVDGGEEIWRCSCGAFGPEPWIYLRPDKPRVWTFWPKS